jgi:hypothetical protein
MKESLNSTLIENTTAWVKSQLQTNDASHVIQWKNLLIIGRTFSTSSVFVVCASPDCERFTLIGVALSIAREEQQSKAIDLSVVELSALLHDVADSKVPYLFKIVKFIDQYGGSDDLQRKLVSDFLHSNNCAQKLIDDILYVIMNVSYRKELCKSEHRRESCIELDIVKDADRLDAIGAVGLLYLRFYLI